MAKKEHDEKNRGVEAAEAAEQDEAFWEEPEVTEQPVTAAAQHPAASEVTHDEDEDSKGLPFIRVSRQKISGGWMETHAANVSGLGVIVRTSTQVNGAVSESTTFVPNGAVEALVDKKGSFVRWTIRRLG